jgi:hypothetical protein
MTYSEIMTKTFDWCVNFLQSAAPIFGMNYKEINIWLFVIAQPILVVVLFLLWQRERFERRRPRS